VALGYVYCICHDGSEKANSLRDEDGNPRAIVIAGLTEKNSSGVYHEEKSSIV